MPQGILFIKPAGCKYRYTVITSYYKTDFFAVGAAGLAPALPAQKNNTMDLPHPCYALAPRTHTLTGSRKCTCTLYSYYWMSHPVCSHQPQ